jgi:hypothetical protein
MCEIRAGELMAWATCCGEERFSPGREDLLTQHALLAMALGACLPVRFPTWLEDENAVRELLAQRRSALLTALARVRGRVELAVTASWTTPARAPEPTLTTSPGRRYLEERRRAYASADEQRAQAQRLATLIAADERIIEAHHALCPSDEIGLSSALLVSQTDALAVAKRLRDLREGVRILVNGPWPPYSFVSLEG